MQSILVMAVGEVAPDLREHLVDRLAGPLGVPVKGAVLRLDPEPTFDPNRRQYRSDLLLAELAEKVPPQARLLGLADVDLFIPVLSFVFGEAQLDGRVAVVSAYRLRNEQYGLPADPELLVDRLVKEAVHELGHTYGLIHCHTPGCVMQPSTYVELIDLKSSRFCAACGGLVRSAGALPQI